MATLNQVLDEAKSECGFLSAEGVKVIAQNDRLRMLLVRWNEGRALVPAQNVAGIIDATEKGGWSVRDVSLPSSDPAMR